MTSICFETMHHRTLNSNDLAPESARPVETLMDPYDPAAKNQGPSEDPAVKNIAWTQSKYFTVEIGQRQIHDFIKTWALPSSWLYSLDFQGVTKEHRLAVYHYRARFSTPTARSPIVGTASVYFTVSTGEPDTQPVDVRYVIESNRLVHRADSGLFREKWLQDVIESKILLRKTVQDLWTKRETGAGATDSAPS